MLKQTVSGGYIERYVLDLAQKRFDARVEVLSEGVLAQYDLTFEELSDFSFDDESVAEWERLQLSDIWVDETPAESSREEWGVTISLWDVGYLKIRSAAVLIDGDLLR